MGEQGVRMNRSVEARLHAAQLRKRTLLESETSLREELTRIRRDLAACEQEIALCEDAGRPRRKGVAEETWRRTVRQLGTFTVSELGTELGVTVQTARKHLDTMLKMDPPIVKADGRSLGQKLYVYCKPTDAGAAFETQHRLRPVGEDFSTDDAPLRGVAVAGTGSRPEDAIVAKPVRAAVRGAIAAGWTLHPKGDGHWSLRKGDQEVGVAGTPKNPDGTAQLIRRKTATKHAS